MRRSVLGSLALAAAMLAPAWAPANAGVGVCGDGVVNGLEACDDANTVSGDCCSATCTLEIGGPCDDGDACNGADSCSPTCTPVAPPVCTTAAARTSLAIDPAKGTVSFAWQKGTVAPAELGDPTTEDTDYLLCVEQGNEALPVLTLAVAGGGTCGTKPCWKSTAKGFTFKSQDPGVRSISLVSGAEGKAKLTLQAKGAALPALGGALLEPVRARLTNGAACWEQIFFDTEVKKNDGTRYKAKRKGLPVM
jgi:cysteine-rich repeat protein